MNKILEKVSGVLSYLKEQYLRFLVFLSLIVFSIIPFLSDLYTPETKDTPTDIPDICIKQYRLGGAIPGKNDCTRKAITTHGGMGGYHCTGSQGYIWAESYCNLNKASTEYQKKVLMALTMMEYLILILNIVIIMITQ